jgi:hypothetical protein
MKRVVSCFEEETRGRTYFMHILQITRDKRNNISEAECQNLHSHPRNRTGRIMNHYSNYAVISIMKATETAVPFYFSLARHFLRPAIT